MTHNQEPRIEDRRSKIAPAIQRTLSSILDPRLSRSPVHPLTRSPARLLAISLFLLFLAIYVRTAAPSVLSGDSAEFQLAAPLLGVPHPTTYPLYILIGKLATVLLPFGDMAWRVTLVSASCAALAVALFFRLAWRLTGSIGAALVAALALGATPGLWNAATLAEVYALVAALLAGLGCLLATTDDRRPTTGGWRNRAPRQATPDARRQTPDAPLSEAKGPRAANPYTPVELLRLRAAAFVAGLGCTHHGLFVLTGLPLLIAAILWMLARPTTDRRQQKNSSHFTFYALRFTFYSLPSRQLAILALCFAAGLAPWLYPLAQFARYGPFDGTDYGLPRHYFWGAPQSWGALLDLLSGGAVRRGIFRLPSATTTLATLRLVGQRLWFEFGPLGVALGVLGCFALARRSRAAWAGAAWVFLSTLAYLLLLGPTVADAPIFTLPMLLPWALWIAAAVEAMLALWAHQIGDRRPPTADHRPPTTDHRPPTAKVLIDPFSRLRSHISHLASRVSGLASQVSRLRSRVFRSPAQIALLTVLIAATLAWGYTRVQYSSKRRLWLFREFGQATLVRLPPGAAVIAHWEQGMTLQYLRLVEGQRPDVWVDVVEPADEGWGARARRRYADRPVFFIGRPVDIAGLPVELVREDAYADLFRLREAP